jgi:hypothetical protein
MHGLILLSTLASAGEHRSICQRAADADLVYEMRFTQKGRYPSAVRSKGWAPPTAELLATARTGEVSHVFKGSIPLGSSWNEAYGIGFQMSASVAKWDEFFANKQFSKVYFLAESGTTYKTTGGAEESAGCGSSDHWSWCSSYDAFKAEVRACLSPK